MNTKTYLEQLKQLAPRPSVYAVARLLELDEHTVRNWYLGRSLPDAFACVKIAEILDLDPMRVIAEIETEREKDEGKRARWRALAKKLGALVIAVIPSAIGPTGDSEAATQQPRSISDQRAAELCIMSTALRRLKQWLRLRGFGRFPDFVS